MDLSRKIYHEGACDYKFVFVGRLQIMLNQIYNFSQWFYM
jgi:hypothetical protein